MPFGAIYGALFFGVLSLGMLFTSAGPRTLPMLGVRWCLALLGLSLAVGLLLRRSWARWCGILFTAVTAALVTLVLSQRSGVGELVVLFGSLTAFCLLVVSATGDVRRGMPHGRLYAPGLGRVAAVSTVVGLLGLAASLGWGSAGPAVSWEPESAALPASAVLQRVVWTDFGTGKDRAAAENKPMLVNFVTNWCGYCRKMDRTTWNAREVVDKLDSIVAVRVDAESQAAKNGYRGEQLAQQFQVTGYPTMLLLDPHGRVLSRSGGYLSPTDLVDWVERSMGPARTQVSSF